MKKGFSVSLALMLCAMLSLGALAEDAPIGIWEGNVFTSEVAGLVITLPEGWVPGEGEALGVGSAEDDRSAMDMVATEESTESMLAMIYIEPDNDKRMEELAEMITGGSGEEAGEDSGIQEFTIGNNTWYVLIIEHESFAGMYYMNCLIDKGLVMLLYMGTTEALSVEDVVAMIS